MNPHCFDKILYQTQAHSVTIPTAYPRQFLRPVRYIPTTPIQDSAQDHI